MMRFNKSFIGYVIYWVLRFDATFRQLILSLFFIQVEGKGHNIRRSLVDGNEASVFIGPGLHTLDIAIDMIGRLLFWTCSQANAINVTRFVHSFFTKVMVDN